MIACGICGRELDPRHAPGFEGLACGICGMIVCAECWDLHVAAEAAIDHAIG